MEVVMHLGCDYQRGAHVDDIQDLNHMLLLAHWISRHRGGIFAIDLPGLHGFWTRHRLMFTA
jgi:hypothetical protein